MTLSPQVVLRSFAALALGLSVGLAGCGGSNGGPAHGVRIETVAGGLNLGDGGSATATFVNPTNVAVDARGDVLVIDANDVVAHWIVRRIDARGAATHGATIDTVGGPCDPYAQADPPERICDLLSYGAITVRGTREFFIATHDQRIFRVDAASGALEHLAGRGGFNCTDVDGAPPRETCLGYAGSIAVDDSGNLYFGEIENGVIRRLDADGLQIATVASGLTPNDIAIGPTGDLYVADTPHHHVDRVDPASGLVVTIAGTGESCDGERGDGGPAPRACFTQPTAVAVGSDGTIFVADGDRLRRIDGATGIITTIARRDFVDRLAIAPDGDVVFTEPSRHAVSRLNVDDGTITIVAGNGTLAACGEGGARQNACLGIPYGAAPAPDGSIYFADGENGRIGRVDASGTVTTVVAYDSAKSCGDIGPRRDLCLHDPSALVRARDGVLYFADRGTAEEGDEDTRPGRVRRFDPATGVVTTIAGNCTVPGSTRALEECVTQPSSLLLDEHGGLLVGSQLGVHRIDLANGTIRQIVGGRRLATNCKDDGIEAVDSCIAGNDLALDAAGNLYVSSIDDYRVRRVDAATGLIRTIAGNGSSSCPADDVPATSACVYPFAIALAGDRLVVATDGTLRTVDLVSGLIHTVDGFPPACGSVAPIPPTCTYPWDMTFDQNDRLVVAETITRSIRRITLP